MPRTLAQLRDETLAYLFDPTGSSIPGLSGGNYAPLDALINLAYDDLVVEMDTAPQPWDMVTTPITLSVATGTREYALTPAGISPPPVFQMIRKVLQVVRVIDGRERAVSIVGWNERNSARDGGLVYIVRDHRGDWLLGMVPEEFDAMTLRVYYTLVPDPLSDPAKMPMSIPPMHHSLIAVRAALVQKANENRDPGLLAGLWTSGLKRMHQDLGRLHGPNFSRVA